MQFYSQVDRQRNFLRLRRWGACGAKKDFVRGGGRDFKSVDLPRGSQIKEKVKVVKNIDIAILKCLQRFVIAS